MECRLAITNLPERRGRNRQHSSLSSQNYSLPIADGLNCDIATHTRCRYGVLMWRLAVFVLALSAPVGQRSLTVDGEAFGASLTLTCTWFTNFENSRFAQCHDATGKLLRDGDGASIKCVGDNCSRLDAAARKEANWQKPEPLWGTFTVRLVGRVSIYPHKKRFLGDATRTVLLEKIISVKLLT